MSALLAEGPKKCILRSYAVISELGCGSCRCGFPPVLAVAARRRDPSFASPTALPFRVKSLGVIPANSQRWVDASGIAARRALRSAFAR